MAGAVNCCVVGLIKGNNHAYQKTINFRNEMKAFFPIKQEAGLMKAIHYKFEPKENYFIKSLRNDRHSSKFLIGFLQST
jgi:hypothetical protein